MRLSRLAVLALLLAPSGAHGCTCATTGSACTLFHQKKIVFLGLVTEDSGPGLGTGPARMLVEEAFHGLPADIGEITVNTLAGTSCYARLEKGQRYVIFSSSPPGKVITRDPCSFSFAVQDNEALVAALRQAERGGGQRLVGRVRERRNRYDFEGVGVPGVHVTAVSGANRLETSSGSAGEFQFLKVAPGTYQLSVSSPDFVEDTEWRSEDPPVSTSTCGYQTLFVSPNGTIQGVVRNSDGSPAIGVPVQAFPKDEDREPDNLPLKERKSDENGEYVLSGLPPGRFVIGVNGEKYDDRQSWAPTFYPDTRDRNKADFLTPGRGQKLTGIDLKLPVPRISATLRVESYFEDGSPAIGAVAHGEDLLGVGRVSSMESEGKSNVLTIPVYVGERYIIKGRNVAGPKTWEGTVGPITIEKRDTQIRMVLHEVTKSTR
jgi:hypothetical protein